MLARPRNSKVDDVDRSHHYCNLYKAHFASDFVRTSRFDETELKSAIEEMEVLTSREHSKQLENALPSTEK